MAVKNKPLALNPVRWQHSRTAGELQPWPSPFSSSSSLSGMMGCGGEKELCTDRMVSLLPIASPAVLHDQSREAS